MSRTYNKGKKMTDYLNETRLLDYMHPRIQLLIRERGWRDLPEFDRIGAAYEFVLNEIKFGYNATDNMPASAILAEGYGQCNTKAILLMALFRALDIPCRFHGFTIHKQLQRGVVPEIVYLITPDNILHSWVDVRHDNRWITLEGFIVDEPVLLALRRKFPTLNSLCGYGIGTDCLQAPDVGWTGKNTYIQLTGINQDFDLFYDPDPFFDNHAQAFSPFRKWLYQRIIRHWMNSRVEKMRKGIVPNIPSREDGFVSLKLKLTEG